MARYGSLFTLKDVLDTQQPRRVLAEQKRRER